MADANSAYRLADAEFLRKFDAFELMMIEQPLEWDDMYHHSKLQTLLKTPIAWTNAFIIRTTPKQP